MSKFLALMLLFAVQAQACPSLRQYEYWVRVPVTSRTCQAEAEALGQRFKAATGALIDSATCLGTVEASGGVRLNSLSVLYRYCEQLFPNSAILGGGSGIGSVPEDTIGAYPNYQECLADLDRQRDLYEENTGLAAVAVYCQPGRVSLDSHEYVLRIDGFGRAKSRLFVYRHPHMSVRNTDFDQAAREFIAAGGGQLVHESPDTFFYYNPITIPILRHTLGFYRRNGDCETQLPEVSAMFTTLKTAWASRCIETDYGANLEVMYVNFRMISSDLGIGSVHYYSLDECMENRMRMKLRYDGRGVNRYPVAAICRPDDSSNGYTMEILYQY